ncbi:carbon-nitrogen hydrolase family protein [Kocuria flava]|uniref:carbon-nitrogen hydrolase family protein n=1 Tax=Kocuria flava TaxID=446860 RepID=UPI001FF2CAB7|nr:carbon-nitrogen hydrolase family protein [Kocuria flava]MCJ8504631.1 carbon-nitrogen hydrolase family protein [Kocuria flava]
MKIAVGQFAPTADTARNLETMRRQAEEAAAAGAGLIVFPEEAMLAERLIGEDFAVRVLEGWSGFVQQLSFLAARTRIAVLAGGYETSADGRPYNTLVTVGADGAILGTYRKLHLYDAFSHRESDRIRPGDRGVTVVPVGELRVGMITCYDLRFPEVCRAVVDAGAEVLAVPAAWFAGEHKVDHWQALLKARAIENTVWVVAADTCSEHTIGRSAVLDPLGAVVAEAGEEETVLCAEVDRARIDEVREVVPVLANRRFAPNAAISDPDGEVPAAGAEERS